MEYCAGGGGSHFTWDGSPNACQNQCNWGLADGTQWPHTNQGVNIVTIWRHLWKMLHRPNLTTIWTFWTPQATPQVAAHNSIWWSCLNLVCRWEISKANVKILGPRTGRVSKIFSRLHGTSRFRPWCALRRSILAQFVLNRSLKQDFDCCVVSCLEKKKKKKDDFKPCKRRRRFHFQPAVTARNHPADSA